MAIIHLVQRLPVGSSDLPGGRIPILSGFGRAALLTPPYLILHREEFAWPRLSPNAPVRFYFKPTRAAPFHPLPSFEFSNLRSEISNRAGLLSVALVVVRSISDCEFQIQSRPCYLDLSAVGSGFENCNLRLSDAPLLAGSLPFSVRTFLSRSCPSWIKDLREIRNPVLEFESAATARPVHLQGFFSISKLCSTGTASLTSG
jgi:hypothetical protein